MAVIDQACIHVFNTHTQASYLAKLDQVSSFRVREAQFEERKLWDEKTATAETELKAKGVQFVKADKAAFYKATQPIRDKYGAKYAALLKRIADTK